MARLNLRIIAIAVLSFVAIACGDDAAQATGTLQGRTFLSDAVTVRNEPKTLVAGTRIRLTFPAKDRITATAGCNILSGGVRIADSRVLVTDLGSTEMGCDPARHLQDEWLATVLTARPSYRLDGSRLVLETEDTVVQLLDREVADPDRPLIRTIWMVDGLISGTTASSIPSGTSATVVFDASTVQISIDSCNESSAKVKIGSSTIEFETLVTTDIACSDAPARLEAAITAVLNGKVDYSIEAGSLRLTRSGDEGLTLKAR
ncbi:MAG TPA: META domain-containing protein [Acidimicrobiales bacterium]|nr:META domain-containing protein [Acidimicrobiales bacterium]